MASMRLLFAVYLILSLPALGIYVRLTACGLLRPLGIPAYEDKLVQGVMRKVLDQVYEGKFYDFSYGFREGKSCHQAIRDVNQLIMTKNINFIVDADIKGFFDNAIVTSGLHSIKR